MPPLDNPILVIAYGEHERKAIEDSLQNLQIPYVSCASFKEAEKQALQGIFIGILVDLPTMVKAKGDEKAIACSLTGFFPTLRVRSLGSILVPMIMPGGSRQDSSLKDFINNSCAKFSPRRIRTYRRHECCLSVNLLMSGAEMRSFTGNISWDGAFVAHSYPENSAVNDEINMFFPEFSLSVPARIIWIQPWGVRRIPGFGVQFLEQTDNIEAVLAGVLRISRDTDRDRILG